MAESPPPESPGSSSPPVSSEAQASAAGEAADPLAGKDVSFELPPETIPDPSDTSTIDQSDIDELLKQAQFDDVATASADADPFGGSEALSDSSGSQVDTCLLYTSRCV